MQKALSQFVILGCGHSESLEHFNNNAAVLNKNGNLLIDCGHTIKHALSAHQMDIGMINAIFITHVHGDHVFGLERVAYESKFKYKKRVKLFIHESILKELWDQTLKGSLGRNGDGEATLNDYFDVTLIRDDHFEYCGNQFQLIRVSHTPNKPTFGLLINQHIFYSSDTVSIPNIVTSYPFKIGFHDVTLSNWNPVHATLESLVKDYPINIRKKLYLMSYEDSWRHHEEIVDQEFKGFAKQGLTFNL